MNARRIPKMGLKERHHRFYNTGVHRSRCAVIEVDHAKPPFIYHSSNLSGTTWPDHRFHSIVFVTNVNLPRTETYLWSSPQASSMSLNVLFAHSCLRLRVRASCSESD